MSVNALKLLHQRPLPSDVICAQRFSHNDSDVKSETERSFQRKQMNEYLHIYTSNELPTKLFKF